jgi:hypothetical protein
MANHAVGAFAKRPTTRPTTPPSTPVETAPIAPHRSGTGQTPAAEFIVCSNALGSGASSTSGFRDRGDGGYAEGELASRAPRPDIRMVMTSPTIRRMGMMLSGHAK